MIPLRGLRYVGAVVFGFAVVVVLSTATDSVLHAIGVYPPESQGLWDPALNALALAYRCIFTVLGGYVCAWLSPAPKTRAVWALAILGQIGGLAGLLATWNMNLGPHWYPIALAATAIPTVLFGGWLRLRSASTTAA
jgi:hypothetical protein